MRRGQAGTVIAWALLFLLVIAILTFILFWEFFLPGAASQSLNPNFVANSP